MIYNRQNTSPPRLGLIKGLGLVLARLQHSIGLAPKALRLFGDYRENIDFAWISTRSSATMLVVFLMVVISAASVQAQSISASTADHFPGSNQGDSGYVAFGQPNGANTFLGAGINGSGSVPTTNSVVQNSNTKIFALYLPGSRASHTSAYLTVGNGVQISQSDLSCPGATISIAPSGAAMIGLSAGSNCQLLVTFPSGSGAYAGATISGTLGRERTQADPNFSFYTFTSGWYTAPPVVAPGAPTIGTATRGDAQATVAFTPPASNGGATITSYTVTSSPGNLTATGASSPLTVTGLTNGTAYTFTVRATNSAGTSVASAASNSVTPAPNATPATEFAGDAAEIRAALTGDARRNLNSTMAMNRNMLVDARDRFVEQQLPDAEGLSDVPVDVDGTLDVQGTTISSKGTFFGQTDLNGGTRRLVFGDFDIQHDGDTGSRTATITGRVAWEQITDDRTMLGYFIGGDLAQSNIAGEFDGDQNRFGVTAGAYGVREISKQVYLDGFFSLGAGRNNLTMSNGVLDLDSDYTTRSATMGAALSGVIEQQGFDILPELSLSFGRTWIGDVGFTGAAHSLVDNTLSLDAGTVTLANILFRPEFRVPMDGLSGAQSLQVFSFAPRLSCEQVKTNVTEENCGAGAELGFSGSSVDGLSSVSAKIMADRLGDRTTSSVQLNLQHRF